MITEKDLTIITHLRNNARMKTTIMAKELRMPVTTIYDKIRNQEKKGILKRHTVLLDYAKLGYDAKVMLAISVPRSRRQSLTSYLLKHPNVNSLYGVDVSNEMLAEIIFEDASRMREFIDNLDVAYGVSDIRTFNLSQELKKEEFLTGRR